MKKFRVFHTISAVKTWSDEKISGSGSVGRLPSSATRAKAFSLANLGMSPQAAGQPPDALRIALFGVQNVHPMIFGHHFFFHRHDTPLVTLIISTRETIVFFSLLRPQSCAKVRWPLEVVDWYGHIVGLIRASLLETAAWSSNILLSLVVSWWCTRE